MESLIRGSNVMDNKQWKKILHENTLAEAIGVPKKDGSGMGMSLNKNRGGCYDDDDVDDEDIDENSVNEASSAWRPLVGKVSNACGWDYNECQEFIEALLINCNFHTEAKKVYNFMNKL